MTSCPKCGLEVADDQMFCPSCETRLIEFSEEKGMEAIREMSNTICWYASIARTAVLLSIFIIPAPFALIFGILTLRDIKAHPEKEGKFWGYLGIIVGGLVTFFLFIIWFDKTFPGVIK